MLFSLQLRAFRRLKGDRPGLDPSSVEQKMFELFAFFFLLFVFFFVLCVACVVCHELMKDKCRVPFTSSYIVRYVSSTDIVQ